MNNPNPSSTGPWVKSSYSGGNGGNCVEWSPAHARKHHTVPVRDSKAPEGPVLTLPTAAFSSFIAGLKNSAI